MTSEVGATGVDWKLSGSRNGSLRTSLWVRAPCSQKDVQGAGRAFTSLYLVDVRVSLIGAHRVAMTRHCRGKVAVVIE